MWREIKQSFKMLCHCEPISSSFTFQYLILKHRELEIWLFLSKHPFVDSQRFSQGMSLHEERKRPDFCHKSWKCDTIYADSHGFCYSHGTVKCFPSPTPYGTDSCPSVTESSDVSMEMPQVFWSFKSEGFLTLEGRLSIPPYRKSK